MASGLFLMSIGPKQGKTLVASALAAALRRRSLKLAVMKPIDTGCALAPIDQPVQLGGLPGSASAEELAALHRLAQIAGPPPAATLTALPQEALLLRDAPTLLAAAQLEQDPALVTQYRFAPELEPAVLARLADCELDLSLIQQSYQQLASQADFVIVEGLAGPLTPLTAEALQCDLIRLLALPVLLLAPSAAGIANDSLLALEALRSRDIPLAGVVLNRLHKEISPEEASSPFLIEQFAGPLIRGVLPYYTATQRVDWEFLSQRLEVHLDLDAILAACP